MALLKEESYTIEDIYALPDGERAELIGNTPEVNENFYTYDVSESDYKKELIRKVSLCG